ncbi:MAG: hypothetical protein PSX36_02680 [bacterium]|nr:hypothetical protein [bacterium]
MKKNVLVLFAVVCSIVGAKAQQEKDEIQMIQSMWGMEKRTMVTDYMKFTAAEATAFWPLYDAFQTDLRKLGSDRIMIINDYAKKLILTLQ